VASGDEQAAELSRRQRQRNTAILPGAFSAEVLGAMATTIPGSAAATRLLVAAADAIGRVYPPDLDGMGISRRTRLNARSSHPVRERVDQVAALIGVEFDAYTHGMRDPLVSVELTEPPSLVLAEHMARRPEGEQNVLIAYHMVLIALRCYPVARLTPAELGVALAAATRSVITDHVCSLLSEDELEQYAQRIRRQISRRWRRPLETAAMEYAVAPAIDLEKWQQSLRQSAMRGAVILCDDLLTAVQVVRQLDGIEPSVQGAQLVRRSPMVADLLRFWASSKAGAVRRQVGLGSYPAPTQS
jgi:hypothetical protein